MKNFETDPDRINEAFSKGIITPEDFKKWQALQGYDNALKKSLSSNQISKAAYTSEQKNIGSFFWERDFSEARLKFKLTGKDFNPINVLDTPAPGTEIKKANESEPILGGYKNNFMQYITELNELGKLATEFNAKNKKK